MALIFFNLNTVSFTSPLNIARTALRYFSSRCRLISLSEKVFISLFVCKSRKASPAGTDLCWRISPLKRILAPYFFAIPKSFSMSRTPTRPASSTISSPLRSLSFPPCMIKLCMVCTFSGPSSCNSAVALLLGATATKPMPCRFRFAASVRSMKLFPAPATPWTFISQSEERIICSRHFRCSSSIDLGKSHKALPIFRKLSDFPIPSFAIKTSPCSSASISLVVMPSPHSRKVCEEILSPNSSNIFLYDTVAPKRSIAHFRKADLDTTLLRSKRWSAA